MVADSPPPETETGPERPGWVLPALLALAALAYGPLLLADFVWDDQLLVIDLERRGAGWLQLFTSDLWAAQAGPGPSSSSYYRPLTSLDFALLHRMFGPSPLVFHALSLLVHLVTAGLLFRVVARATAAGWVPVLATTVFLFHPLQQEAVAFVSARNDLWAGLACVLAAAAWQSDRPARAAAALFVGLLFKETALAILPMVAAWDLAAGRRDWLRRTGIVGLALVPYLALRLGVAGVSSDPGGALGVTGIVGYGAHWVRALLLPLEVGPYRPLEPLDGALWTWPVVLAALGAGGLAIWRRPETAPGLAVAAAALVLALPVSLAMGYTGDRYAYVAMVGLALAAPGLLAGVPGRVVLALVGVLGLGCLGLNTSSLPRWSSHAALMAHGEAADPTGRASYELAKSRSSVGDFPAALAAGRRAAAGPFPHLPAWEIVAAMELSMGNPQGALEALDAARAAGVPDMPRSLVNRAACLRHLGRHGEVPDVVAALVALGEDEDEVRARIDRIAPPPEAPAPPDDATTAPPEGDGADLR